MHRPRAGIELTEEEAKAWHRESANRAKHPETAIRQIVGRISASLKRIPNRQPLLENLAVLQVFGAEGAPPASNPGLQSR